MQQPPARMTFKFDGSHPREVRVEHNTPTKAEALSDKDETRPEAFSASASSGAAKSSAPRGFSRRTQREEPAAGGGYRLPGKGAQLAGERSPLSAADRGGGAESRNLDARTDPYTDLRDAPYANPQQAGSNAHGGQQAGPSGASPQPRRRNGSDARRSVGSDAGQAAYSAAPSRPNTKPANNPKPVRGFKSEARRDSRQSPYQDDIQALEDMIRGTEQPQTRNVTGFSRTPAPAVYTPPIDDDSHREGVDGRREHSGRRRRAESHGEMIETRREDDRDDLAYGNTPADRSFQAAGGADESGEPPGYMIRSRRGPSWLRILLSVAGAIVTGALFGYIVLALFTGEPLLPAGGADAPAAAGASAPAAKPAAGTSIVDAQGQKDAPSAPASPSSGASAEGGNGAANQTNQAKEANISASVSYLLQYGVFQSEASMNDAVQELAAQGIAAATDTTEGYRVYAGIAATKAEADALAAALTDSELYVKALNNEALKLPQTDVAVSWTNYIETSDALGRLLGNTSAGLLAQGGLKPVGERASADTKAALKAWEQAAAGLEKWAGSHQSEAASLAAELKAAAEQMSAYEAKPAASKLRAVQTSAMKAALIAAGLRDWLGMDGD